MTPDLANEPAIRLNHVRQTDREAVFSSSAYIIGLFGLLSENEIVVTWILNQGRLVVKQLRALDWMAIDGASRKQNSSFGPSDSNSPGESNQTFMLNHETIHMESANKRAALVRSFDSPIYSSSADKKLMDIPRRTKGFGLVSERERADGAAALSHGERANDETLLALEHICMRRAFAATTTTSCRRCISPPCCECRHCTIYHFSESTIGQNVTGSSASEQNSRITVMRHGGEPAGFYERVELVIAVYDAQKVILGPRLYSGSGGGDGGGGDGG
ncbi:Uncharacterized protein DBV15_00664 [Temnothorax longispinosus]|uniref:Uncharacterized protein n=1 Tax=Temnothorax longispinosus TaxID=300112 RepID=A0A4S2KSA0_9HYME|nr:Uncharacterized protein DBV15_00664 [Temnothorax longispinosus]